MAARLEGAMDELIKNLCSRTGISQDQAKQVVEYLKQNADKIPQWLGTTGVAGKVAGAVTGFMGGGKPT